MKKLLSLLSSLFIINLSNNNAQILLSDTSAFNKPIPNASLCEKDMYMLSGVAELFLPEEYKSGPKSVLPSSIDNSTQPFARSTTWQNGYECGQSASIVHNFTYEINFRRNLPANILSNQYTAHFAWDFFNNGEQYKGVSLFDTWEVMKYCGAPNVQIYGGHLWYGGFTRWMSGYAAYYNAMQNRISDGYYIRAGTPEGLLTLKHWIHDHLDGSSVGGYANFYAQYAGTNATLPVGTPQAGKAVMTSFGSSPSHTWTVVGYDDSIRYDYNNDGRYTNDIDLNSDGIIDMRDWEIGGLKFLNGYSGDSWGNLGYAYMMYKTLGESINTGGIWNHGVYIIKVKPFCQPILTAKLTLNHNSRDKIKVIAGYNTNIAASRPSKTMDFPIFNYQGGDYYMQGDTSVAAKTLEFGLDISPLLSEINSGQNVKYFISVVENDPSGVYTGSIINYSIIDYAGGSPVEIPCSSSNVPLINNDTTTLSLTKTFTFDKISINTSSLLPASLNNTYSTQMQASGGAAPYRWSLQYEYNQEQSNIAFPNVSNEQLSTNTPEGYAFKKIAFKFPFCGKSYDSIWVSEDGYIRFDNQLYNWPFLINKYSLFKETRIITPFHADLSLSGGGIWYKGDANSATFRWKGVVSGQGTSDINIAVKIYSTGKIEFYYGNISFSGNIDWIAGYSGGDYKNYSFLPISNSFTSNTVSKLLSLTPYNYPQNMSITNEGMLTYTPETPCNNCEIRVVALDNANIMAKKSIPLTVNGVQMDYAIFAGGDTIVQAGDTVNLNMHLTNIGTADITNGIMKLRTSNPNVNIIDSSELLPTLIPNNIVDIAQAFKFIVDTTVTDGSVIRFDAYIFTPSDTFTGEISITVNAFILQLGLINIADGNDGQLAPGETSALIITLKNIGGAAASNISAKLKTYDDYVSIISDSAYINRLVSDESANLFYIIKINDNAPLNHVIVFFIDIKASNGYSSRKYFCLSIGKIIETFETQNFDSFDWNISGDLNWFITDSASYTGDYCARSGRITHNQSSSLSVTMNVSSSCNISFYKKLACERDANNHNYDYLAFYIDGEEQTRWDGDVAWSQSVYPINSGQRTIKWSYVKDYSVSYGSDCAWLDDIILPISYDIPFGIGNSVSDINILNSYPNPFGYETCFEFNLNSNTLVSLNIYDITGKIVKTFFNNALFEQGKHLVIWDASDNNGNILSKGVYFAHLITARTIQTIKIVKQ